MYSEQEEDYMRIIETRNDMLEARIKEYKNKYFNMKKERDDYKRIVETYQSKETDIAPNHSEEDFQRLRTQARMLQKKYRNAQTIIEELRAENEKLSSELKIRVKK
jgi:hypothetical protein